MRVIIWGTGKALEKEIGRINIDEVVCFVNSDASGKEMYCGKPIIRPNDILLHQYDFLVVGSTRFWEDISSMCIYQLGIDCSRIINLKMLVILSNSSEKIDTESRMEITYGKRLINGGVVSYKLEEAFDYSHIYSEKYYNYKGYLIPVSVTYNVSIFQISHKDFKAIGNPGYYTIGVGAYSSSELRDNSDVNISYLNSVINEYTAIYWLWKNYKCDYVGINHYRRVFESNNNSGWPMQIVEVEAILKVSDVIVASPEIFRKMTIPQKLSEQVSRNAYEISFTELKHIFQNKDEAESEAFERVMSEGLMYPCNMFVMKWELFDGYCSWIFPILFKMIDRIKIDEKWDNYSKRIIGFWAERLLTVWIYWQKVSVYESSILLLDDEGPFGK